MPDPAHSGADTALLELDAICKSFGRVVVADNLSVAIGAGDLVGIVGPNGAGKSSLFGLIAGDLAPSSGEIRFAGAAVTKKDAAARCRLGIGRTFQVPKPFGAMTVFENVLVAVQQGAGLRRRASYAAAAAALERTGLAADANAPAERLGLLSRKRLEVARALATDPRLLLLDEVAGGLTDPEVAQLARHRPVRVRCWRGHHLDRARRTRTDGDRRPATLPGRWIAHRRRRARRRTRAARGPRGVPRHRGVGVAAGTRAGSRVTAVDAASPLLEVRDLSVHHGQLQALRNVSLSSRPAARTP